MDEHQQNWKEMTNIMEFRNHGWTSTRPLHFGFAGATQHRLLSLCSSIGSKGVSCDSPTFDATSDLAWDSLASNSSCHS